VAQQIKDLVNNLKELDKVNVKSAGWMAALDGLDNTGKIEQFNNLITETKQKIIEYKDLANRQAAGGSLTDDERARMQTLYQ
jgi:hypothetical protein